MQKPADLFLGIIDFLGIFVPGAVVVFLHGDTLLSLLTSDPATLSGVPGVPAWAVVVVASYVVGHVLLAASVPLNALAMKLRRPAPIALAYRREVRQALRQPRRSGSADVFYGAFAYLRLNAPAAVVEVERQMAEYKLFRSLVLVGVLDLALAWAGGRLTPARALIAVAVAAFSIYRFSFLLCWTYRLAFEHAALAMRGAEAPSKPPDAGRREEAGAALRLPPSPA